MRKTFLANGTLENIFSIMNCFNMLFPLIDTQIVPISRFHKSESLLEKIVLANCTLEHIISIMNCFNMFFPFTIYQKVFIANLALVRLFSFMNSCNVSFQFSTFIKCKVTCVELSVASNDFLVQI